MTVTTIHGEEFKLGWFFMSNKQYRLSKRKLRAALAAAESRYGHARVEISDGGDSTFVTLISYTSGGLDIGCKEFSWSQAAAIREWAK